MWHKVEDWLPAVGARVLVRFAYNDYTVATYKDDGTFSGIKTGGRTGISHWRHIIPPAMPKEEEKCDGLTLIY
ncbi:MAG: hypothetical protein A2Z40_03205 [Deltaproteobacteria bacterium RBG_19FT_COMBO_60_16]|nr:MAG: hypothetical protein A2Z40_03205 [Deltaproteobacteria bacterium RBG_19FT_COMBO_60_16]